MKFLSFFLIAILLLQVFAEALTLNDAADSLTQVDEPGSLGGLLKKNSPHKINCSHECARRCSKSSRKNLCHRACKSCCAVCNCVPPGTYGNKNLCPCYAKLKTHGNKPKCP
ncbi:Gibberellin-regulated protein 9 [Abeliophyllum distichum]|uniref:Gibberellin-regulated protein 9 n=1 Tax=Abeliophyllum distichum TaxID=126358 RepID=A0ABD1SRZ0_9LAMI